MDGYFTCYKPVKSSFTFGGDVNKIVWIKKDFLLAELLKNNRQILMKL